MRISTIIPCFNREHLIGETLRSILSQSVPPAEVIVVDDGSSDGTTDVVRSFGDDIRLICQSNHGAGAARNRGLQEATGDFIHFMDSDDLSSLNTYQTQLDALRMTGADVAYGPWIKTRFEPEGCWTQPVAIQQLPLPDQPGMQDWVLRGWVTVFQPCLFRRELVHSLGGYRVDLKPTEDSELLFRIGRAKAKLVHTPETLVIYRVHPEGQVSIANESERERDWLNFLTVMNGHLKNDPGIDRTTRWQFDFRKLDAMSHAAPGIVPALRAELMADIPRTTRIAHRLSSPMRRILSKLRRRAYGDNYVQALGVRPVNDFHKGLMDKLGYSHRGFYNLT